MTRLVLPVVACVLLPLISVVAKERPNVVLFLVDDLGWMDLGCQGSRYYRTPHIDRLAASGIRFTNAYAACAVCTPTRASIMTGRYPARNLMTQWLPAGRWSAKGHRMKEGRFLRSLPLEEVTLAESLRDAGYRTMHVGKWHLGGPPFSLPAHHGFDVNVGGSEHGAPGHYFYPYKGSWKIPTTGQRVQKVSLPDQKLTLRPALPKAWDWMEIQHPNQNQWTRIHYRHDGIQVKGSPKANKPTFYKNKTKLPIPHSCLQIEASTVILIFHEIMPVAQTKTVQKLVKVQSYWATMFTLPQ